MSYTWIATKLKAILDIVQSTSPRLAFVYDTQVPDSPSYPYATLSSGEMKEEELDTWSNIALYSFTIRAVNVAIDKETSEATMRWLADDLLSELRKRENQTLGGTVDRFLPYTLNWWYENSAWSVPSRFFEIKMEIMKNYSID